MFGLPRGGRSCVSPEWVLKQSLGAMSYHTTLLKQGMLPWSLSCPVEEVGKPEDCLLLRKL